MPKKNKLYQCPYELACKCSMTEPCLGCETWAENIVQFKNSSASPKQQLKAKILEFREMIGVFYENDAISEEVCGNLGYKIDEILKLSAV